jgi:uncharacterized membrane protein
MKTFVWFALATAVCWGLYGPVLTKARLADPQQSTFKPFVAIGMAYLVWGVLGGIVGMLQRGDSFALGGAAMRGNMLAFLAGSLGAWGALTLTVSLSQGRNPHVTMPIVFGGAVTVTALFIVLTSTGIANTSPWLWVGIVGIGVGIVLVAANTPHAAPPPKPGSAGPSHAHSAVKSADSSG